MADAAMDHNLAYGSPATRQDGANYSQNSGNHVSTPSQAQPQSQNVPYVLPQARLASMTHGATQIAIYLEGIKGQIPNNQDRLAAEIATRYTQALLAHVQAAGNSVVHVQAPPAPAPQPVPSQPAVNNKGKGRALDLPSLTEETDLARMKVENAMLKKQLAVLHRKSSQLHTVDDEDGQVGLSATLFT